jgi:hypothetical protein
MLQVVHEEMAIAFITETPDLDMLLPLHFLALHARMPEIPWMHGCGGVVFHMLDMPAPLKYEGPEPFLAKFLGGPSAADAGADNDRVKMI